MTGQNTLYDLQNRRAAGFLSPVGSTPTRFRHAKSASPRHPLTHAPKYQIKEQHPFPDAALVAAFGCVIGPTP